MWNLERPVESNSSRANRFHTLLLEVVRGKAGWWPSLGLYKFLLKRAACTDHLLALRINIGKGIWFLSVLYSQIKIEMKLHILFNCRAVGTSQTSELESRCLTFLQVKKLNLTYNPLPSWDLVRSLWAGDSYWQCDSSLMNCTQIPENGYCPDCSHEWLQLEAQCLSKSLPSKTLTGICAG
jgi:hypothetical protein